MSVWGEEFHLSQIRCRYREELTVIILTRITNKTSIRDQIGVIH